MPPLHQRRAQQVRVRRATRASRRIARSPPSRRPRRSRRRAALPVLLIRSDFRVASSPIRSTSRGNAITRQGCGTHTPIADPGASFSIIVDIWQDGAPWGSYIIDVSELKTKWMDVAFMPPQQVCGLAYSLGFHIDAAAPESGNAVSTPLQDTGDPAFANDGIDSILVPPAGSWGSNA
jgi:hypothetical protein